MGGVDHWLQEVAAFKQELLQHKKKFLHEKSEHTKTKAGLQFLEKKCTHFVTKAKELEDREASLKRKLKKAREDILAKNELLSKAATLCEDLSRKLVHVPTK